MRPLTNYKINKNNIILSLLISSIIGVSVSFSDFYLFHFILIIVSVLVVFQIKDNRYKLNIEILKNKYIQVLISIFLWYLVSLFWTPKFELGVKYIFYLICGISIVLSVTYFSKNINNLNKLFKAISIVIFVEIIISLFESFTAFRMPISSYSPLAVYFGKDPINFSDIDSLLMYKFMQPPTGLRWNTNDLAVCMVIALPFFLCSKKTLIKFLGASAIITIIIMTASRASFLGLVLIISLYLIFIKKRIGTLFLVWFSSILLVFGMIQLKESQNPRLNEIANTLEALTLYLSGEVDVGGSLEWRRELLDNGINALKKTYGLGLGAGGTVANQEIMGPVAGRFTSMHNFWVEIFVEGGILIGIILFFWYFLIIYNLYQITKNHNERLKYFSQSLFLSMIAFIPAAIASSSTIYFFPMWVMFGFSISVISISKNLLQESIMVRNN